jgi:hypothetical protein
MGWEDIIKLINLPSISFIIILTSFSHFQNEA